MSITIRKTGNKEYAYMAHRDGARMVQSYIGPLTRPEVRRRVDAAQRATTMSLHTMRLFAGVDPSTLSLQRDAAAIIACLLEQGDLEDLRWLAGVYPESTIIDVVLSAKDVSARARNFWMVWFEVPDAS
ncbi:DUF6922 domain-containing protein [Candidatus Cryosericum odellii]|jgi:hypothetical protein|uniref:DUF6922 domain-containing protein n=1 Tax=Candidatus Cryosericum odellii TaxID=2290917 RepID=A0A398DAP2_9BACT|nr:hypothetical protein [Candidatus Cryosericum odellii]RIE08341.1 hypothetical protein SMC5_08190 [Candidatus Cryosericum odellii]